MSQDDLSRIREILTGEAAPGLPAFCLERWQSLHETKARIVLSESGVEPPRPSLLGGLGVSLDMSSVDLGYGWTAGDPRLREAIAEHYYRGIVDSERVIVATGSAEANLVSVLALASPGSSVIVDMPNYMQVPGLLRLRGARIQEAWRRGDEGWRLPLEDLIGAIRSVKPRLVFVTNPNNPTGAVMTPGEIRDLAREASRVGTILVFDEVYRLLEHSASPSPTVLEAAQEEGATAVSVSGLSKAFGLPGLRIGWAAATERWITERMWAVKDYTTISPSRLSERVAIQVLETGAWLRLAERARSIVSRNLETLLGSLVEGLVEAWPPKAGAFAMLRTPAHGDTVELAYRLYRDRGILVNPGECFGVPGSLRVGLGMEDHERFRTSIIMLVRSIMEYSR